MNKINSSLVTRQNFGVNPRQLGAYYEKLSKNVGTFDAKSLAAAGFGSMATMDTAPTAAISTFNTPVANQFLQNWLPGNVRIFTAPRRAEELLGFVQAGSFADETIVAKFTELFAFNTNYGDLADVSRSGYNMEFLTRQIVRFQGGIQSDRLESDRMAKLGASDIDEKRAAIARAFAITENHVSTYGWTSSRCFGYLNDPNLPSYATVPATGSGSSPLWSDKTTEQQRLDIQYDVNRLFSQTKTAFNPRVDAFTWAITPAVSIALNNLLSIGGTAVAMTLEDWVKRQFPNIRIIVIPELTGANGGADVWYMYKERTVDIDDSTDDGNTMINLIQSRMFQLSALPTKSGGTQENYASAQAGVFVKRPILIVRSTGM